MSNIEGCFNYTMHNESWRNINSSSRIQPNSSSCDARYLRTEWHRFTGAAGTKLHAKCPETNNKCGTANPGWIVDNKDQPFSNMLAIGESKKVMLHFNSLYCAADYGTVDVMECGGFVTYRFLYIPYWSCDYGLCTV